MITAMANPEVATGASPSRSNGARQSAWRVLEAVAVSKQTISAAVVLAGGGLANSLIAMRLRAVRPQLRVIMLEREATIGGEHTWCHFASDVSPAIGAWLAPLIVRQWAGYEVKFPGHRRLLSTPYLRITSGRL